MISRERGALRWLVLLIAVVLVLGGSAPLLAKEDVPKDEPTEESEENSDDESDDESEKKSKKKKKKESKIKPYDEVITEDAKTSVGFFRTHL